MIDTLGMPTIFFTHTAADLQWPELARLICCTTADQGVSQREAVVQNPALADWLFYFRVQKFIEYFYIQILHVSNYWLRYEWQHRGSPHIHGLAWLPNAPDVQQILSLPGIQNTNKEDLIKFIDGLISTCNPAVLPDGSNLNNAPPPKVNPHICSLPYLEVEDHQQDLIARPLMLNICLVVYSTVVRSSHSRKFTLVARKDWLRHVACSMASRVESAQEREERLRRRRSVIESEGKEKQTKKGKQGL